MEYPEQVGFESDGSLVIVDNSANARILSEEDMFTDKIEPIISNLVEKIGVKVLFLKRLSQLPGIGMAMKGKYTQRN